MLLIPSKTRGSVILILIHSIKNIKFFNICEINLQKCAVVSTIIIFIFNCIYTLEILVELHYNIYIFIVVIKEVIKYVSFHLQK